MMLIRSSCLKTVCLVTDFEQRCFSLPPVHVAMQICGGRKKKPTGSAKRNSWRRLGSTCPVRPGWALKRIGETLRTRSGRSFPSTLFLSRSVQTAAPCLRRLAMTSAERCGGFGSWLFFSCILESDAADQVQEREVKEREAKKALARVSRDRFREFLQEKKEQGIITAISR